MVNIWKIGENIGDHLGDVVHVGTNETEERAILK